MKPAPHVEIRELTGDQRAETIFNLGSYSFHPSPPYADRETRLEIIRQRRGFRYFAAIEASPGESGTPVAGAAGASMTQNLRGQVFKSAGIWGVATLPQARRQGYSRQVMSALLSALHDDGFALANLYPFRESFYARMGFTNLHQGQVARFSPQALAPLLKSDLPGQVELALIGEVYSEFRQYLFDLQPHQPGMTLFEFGEPERAAQNRFWVVKAVVEGRVTGMMVYNLSGSEITQFLFWARIFSYRDSLARSLLLSWIARHIDQAEWVELILPAWERPETWLEDLQVKTSTFHITPMGRVLDLTRLDGLPVGEGDRRELSFCARISDPLCPWNEGLWQFSARDGRLQVNPAAGADCELSIQALSALVYGVNDPGEFSLRGWGDPSPALQETLRILFPAQMLYLHDTF